MRPKHWIAIAFWVIIGFLLIKQVHDSAEQHQHDVSQAPVHYFFTHPPDKQQPVIVMASASVQQTNFIVKPDTPTPGNFTCVVTLRNVGGSKAENVQVDVHPFRGGHMGDDNIGGKNHQPINDNDSLGQIDKWVTFPDLNPGESKTESVVFTTMPNVRPGLNRNPQIVFGSAGARP